MFRGDFVFRVYELATMPCRWWLRRRLSRENRSPVTGVFLHRIADDFPNDWSITTKQFDRLIYWLKNNVDLVSIDEAQRRIRDGYAGPRVAVHLSFDDGYADNCCHAIPALLKQNIPFTYYVTSQNIRYGKPFAHDLKRREPLAPNSIEQIQALSDAGVEIGVHTRTHPDMGQLIRQQDIEYEVLGCRDDIAEWTGVEPRHFAFPFGQRENLSPRVIQLLHDNNFASYSSAYGGFNFPTGDAFQLNRFHGDPNFLRFRNWLSFDPRWVYSNSDFEYVPFKRSPPQLSKSGTS